MIKYFLFSFFFLSHEKIIVNVCDSQCSLHIHDSKKITASDYPHYTHPGNEEAAVVTCGKILHANDDTFSLYLYAYYENMAHSYIGITDSTFIKTIGDNNVTFYKQRKRFVKDYFVVISPIHCDSKWTAFIDKVEISSFEAIVREISFSHDKQR